LQRSDQNPAQRRARVCFFFSPFSPWGFHFFFKKKVANLVSSKLRSALASAAVDTDFLLVKKPSQDKSKRGLASRFIRLRNQMDKVQQIVDWSFFVLILS
jgi:hypothetical protein